MNLSLMVANSGLSEAKQNMLLSQFDGFKKTAEDWKEKANLIIVKGEEDKLGMKEADNARKIIKNVRVDIEKTRKDLKEDSLKEGKLIDSIAKELKGMIEPIEDDLTKKANFAKIKQEERENALRLARNEEINPYSEFIPYGLDLGTMPQEDYEKLLNGAKLQLKEKKEREKNEEEERITREKEEAIAREKELAEKKRIEEEFEKEREKNRKLEAEKQALIQKQKDEEKAKLKEQRRLENASDFEKMLHFKTQLESLKFPEVKEIGSINLLEDFKVCLNRCCKEIEELVK